MDIDKIFHVLEYVGKVSESGSIAVNVFIQLSISILIAFLLRICLIFKSAKIKFFGEKKFIKQKAIILNHCGLEILINLIFSYLLLLILNTSNNNLIMNMIIVPLLGQVVAICIDDWYLIPKEKESIFSIIPERENIITANNVSGLIQLHGKLDENLAKSDDFRPIIIQTINDIKQVQEEHEIKIDDITTKCNTSLDLLLKLQRAGKRDKQISLKGDIYDCLNKGFVTPKEREKIAADYKSYIEEFDGNGEIQELFEEHFKKLNIHEDRRKNNVKVEQERRCGSSVNYGKYDKNNKSETI